VAALLTLMVVASILQVTIIGAYVKVVVSQVSAQTFRDDGLFVINAS